MILADTSVWVDHLRAPNPRMADLLGADQIVIHPFVIGELALGNLPRRSRLLNHLYDLRPVSPSYPEEVMTLIEAGRLFGQGLGWVDANLLASTLNDGRVRLWTRDKRLALAAQALQVAFVPGH